MAAVCWAVPPSMSPGICRHWAQPPVFISRVGDDSLGRRIRDTMQQWGLSSAALQLDSAHPTGSVEVTIQDGEPHFEIVAAARL